MSPRISAMACFGERQAKNCLGRCGKLGLAPWQWRRLEPRMGADAIARCTGSADSQSNSAAISCTRISTTQTLAVGPWRRRTTKAGRPLSLSLSRAASWLAKPHCSRAKSRCVEASCGVGERGVTLPRSYVYIVLTGIHPRGACWHGTGGCVAARSLEPHALARPICRSLPLPESESL
jgi:hypothetical protein